MGLFDTLLGRTKPVQADLDALFALPSASITLQSAAGTACSGHAGVCFKPPTGQGFADTQAEVVSSSRWTTPPDLTPDRGHLRLPVARGRGPRHRGPGHPGPPGQLLAVRRRMGSPAALLGLRARRPSTSPRAATSRKRPVGAGTVLPVHRLPRLPVQTGHVLPVRAHRPRATVHRGGVQAESLVADDLTVEADLDRWFPLWDLPVG